MALARAGAGRDRDHRASGDPPMSLTRRKGYRCQSLTANDPEASPQYPTTSPIPCCGASPSTSSPPTNPNTTATAATCSAPDKPASAPRHPTPAERSPSPEQPHAPPTPHPSRHGGKWHHDHPRHAAGTSSAGSRHRSRPRLPNCLILDRDGDRPHHCDASHSTNTPTGRPLTTSAWLILQRLLRTAATRANPSS